MSATLATRPGQGPTSVRVTPVPRLEPPTDDERVTVVEDAPKPPPRRMTLTLPYVLASAHTWVVAVGPRKAPILQHAVLRRDPSTPLDLVVSQGRNVKVLTDQVLKSE